MMYAIILQKYRIRIDFSQFNWHLNISNLTKMDEEPLSLCSVEIDGNGDYFIRGKNKDKCKELLHDISFKED